MAKVDELRDLGTDELAQRVRDLDDQVFRLRLQKSMGKSDAAYKMRGLRRDRARVKTLLREARAGGGAQCRRRAGDRRLTAGSP